MKRANIIDLQKETEEKIYIEELKKYIRQARKESNFFLVDVANSHCNLARVQCSINKFDKAIDNYTQALEIRLKMAKRKAEENLPIVASLLRDMALLDQYRGLYDQADRYLYRSLQTFRQLTEKNPEKYYLQEVETLRILASLYKDTNKVDKAKTAYEKAINLSNTYKINDNDIIEMNCTIFQLAVLEYETGEHDKAEQNFVKIIDLYDGIKDIEPVSYMPNMVDALNKYTALLIDNQRFEEGEQICNKAMEINRFLDNIDPIEYKHRFGVTLSLLGTVQSNNGKRIEAKNSLCEVVEIYRNLLEKELVQYRPCLADSLVTLANFLCEKRVAKRSEADYNEALEIYRDLAKRKPGTYKKKIAHTLTLLASLKKKKNETNNAIADYTEALRLYRILCSKHKNTATDYLSKAAIILLELGKFSSQSDSDKAEKYFQEASNIFNSLDNKANYQKHIDSCQTMLKYGKRNYGPPLVDS